MPWLGVQSNGTGFVSLRKGVGRVAGSWFPACLAMLVRREGQGSPEAFGRTAGFTPRLAIP